ncbi:hypothetical protein L7F22_020575 [Adiantum nelumboides]|nr:hypothetical protein [Adiantum nelumboides]
MPYTPQQNGVAERKNRYLMEMARCMLKAKSLPHKLWMEAVACAAHVLNRCPTRALKTITPYESWYDRKPSVSYLRVFGCLAYAHIPQQLRGKLDDKAVKCIFVGYSSGSKGYRLYNPATNKIFESRDVIFAKTTAQPMVAFDVPHMQTQDVFEGFLPSFVENQESQQVDNFDQSFDQHVTPHDVEEIVHEEQEVLREERTLPKWVQKTLQDSKLDAPLPQKTRAGTTFGREQVDLACFSTLCDADELHSFEQALECVQWKDAMQQEIDSIHKNHTWDLVDLPTSKKPIGTKWIFKVKRKQDGTVDRYKARLVAKGYAQQKGIDYDETFAPTSCASTVRSLVAIAAHHNWKVHQLDIKTTFLNGDLQEEVYVSQPSGFVVKGQEQKVCRLRKALYGLKQAPRAWYEKIHTYLIGQGFQNSPTESTLYVKKRDAVLIMLTLYVDDMLLTGNNENENAAFKDALRKTFEMSDLGLLHYYLGIQFVQSEDGIYMSQAKYLHKILDKFGMQNCKPISTPVDTGSKLSMHDAGDTFDVHTYAPVVGCLIYLAGNTRPDIQFGVSQASRFMHSPGMHHWQAVKRILRYLSGTPNLSMFFPRGDMYGKHSSMHHWQAVKRILRYLSGTPNLSMFFPRGDMYGKHSSMQLLGYSDSDWAGDFDTRHSTSGNCFFLGNACISWLSKKQPTVATSTCEAEYRAAFTATVDCVWIRRLLADLCECQQAPTTIFTDSQSAMAVARNPVFHARTKHIEVHYHYVRERLHAGEITLTYCPTQDNIADLFTKALSRAKFEAFRKALGLLSYTG